MLKIYNDKVQFIRYENDESFTIDEKVIAFDPQVWYRFSVSMHIDTFKV
jgi:tellurite resistance-related uncharacterized protein